jgi:predicted DNA-binding transcriptional regulator YafY
MRRADRLFQLVQLLRSRRQITGGDLAAELGVSVRTVYRDVQDLQGSGVPIRGEAGVGYRLERGFDLPPLTESLALGARVVAAWSDPELAAAAGSAVTKIEAVIPEALRPVLLGAPLYAPSFPSSAAMARNLGALREAIAESRLIHFHYARADGRASQRDAQPLGLFFWGNKWTLAAWCALREDYRSFRPDRMQQLRLLAPHHDPEGPSLAAFMAQIDQWD